MKMVKKTQCGETRKRPQLSRLLVTSRVTRQLAGPQKNTKRVPRVFEAQDAPDCALFHTFVNLFSAVARAPSDPVNFNFCAVAFSYSLTPLFTVN